MRVFLTHLFLIGLASFASASEVSPLFVAEGIAPVRLILLDKTDELIASFPSSTADQGSKVAKSSKIRFKDCRAVRCGSGEELIGNTGQ